jgi:DNA-binding GntR family transcriptional regulator
MTRAADNVAMNRGGGGRKGAASRGGPAASTAGTLAERLRLQISDDIVRGDLAPGIALDEMELAKRFNVSRTPVREAIRLLVASGLVDARPHRSAVVARPGKEQLVGMFEVLCELEVICAGLAAEHMTKAERAELKRLHLALKAVVRDGETLRYYELNTDFHSVIYAGSHNAYLEKLTGETRARIAPFSRAQFTTLGRLEQSYAEHDAVVGAILAGQSAEAATAMRHHIQTVYSAYLDYMQGL